MSLSPTPGHDAPEAAPGDDPLDLLDPPPPLRPERLCSARLRRMGRRLAGVEEQLLRAAVGLGPKGRRA